MFDAQTLTQDILNKYWIICTFFVSFLSLSHICFFFPVNWWCVIQNASYRQTNQPAFDYVIVIIQATVWHELRHKSITRSRSIFFFFFIYFDDDDDDDDKREKRRRRRRGRKKVAQRMLAFFHECVCICIAISFWLNNIDWMANERGRRRSFSVHTLC